MSVDEYVALRTSLGSPPVSERDASLHISRTWAHSPGLMLAQAPLQQYFMAMQSLSPRVREAAILRIGWLCDAPYEFGQHRIIGREAGLTDEEIIRIASPDPGASWSPEEKAALAATDDLFNLRTLTDAVWDDLTTVFEPHAILDLLAVIGRYWTVSVATRSLRLELEPGVEGFPHGHEPQTNGNRS